MMEAVYIPQKCWYVPTSPQSVTTQKTNIDMHLFLKEQRISIENLYHPHIGHNCQKTNNKRHNKYAQIEVG